MLNRHPILAALLTVGGLLVVLGSPGPWLSGLFAHTRGMDGDGQVTLALGALALVIAALSLKRRMLALDVAAAVLLATAGGIGLYDWLSGETMLVAVSDRPDVGWGLALVTVGGLGSMAGALVAGALEGFQRVSVPARIRRS